MFRLERALDIGLRVFDRRNVISIACLPLGWDGLLDFPLRIAKNGAIYGIVLVATNAPDASKILIQTSSGIKAMSGLP